MKQQVGAQSEEGPVDGDAGVDHFLSILREVAPRVVSANAQLEWRLTFSLRWGHPAGPQREDDDRATFAAKCARWSLRVRVPALNMSYIPLEYHPKQHDYTTRAPVCDVCSANGQKADAGERHWSCAILLQGREHELVVGPQQKVEVALLSKRDRVLDTHLFSRSVRTVRAPPPHAQLPRCWLLDEPLHNQDADCVWLWSVLRPSTPVLLSQLELGDGTPKHKMKSVYHLTQHKGSWYYPLYDWSAGTHIHDTWEKSSGFRDSELVRVIRKAARWLPKLPFVEKTLPTCAVVGNAWHLEGSGFGSEIDAHHVVLRVNSPPTLGWERDVGNRTTHRIINAQHTHRLLSMYATMSDPDAQEDGGGGGGRGDTDVQDDDFGVSYGDEEGEEQLILSRPYLSAFIELAEKRRKVPLMLSPSFVDSMHSLFLGRLSQSGSYEMTSGMMGILWAVHACENVTTYGFGGGESEVWQGMVKYSYWDAVPKDPNYFAPIHAWDDEAHLHNRLHRAGALVRRFSPDHGHLQYALLSKQRGQEREEEEEEGSLLTRGVGRAVASSKAGFTAVVGRTENGEQCISHTATAGPSDRRRVPSSLQEWRARRACLAAAGMGPAQTDPDSSF